MKGLPGLSLLIGLGFASSGWAGGLFPRPLDVVDSIPAPTPASHISACFDSSGYLRVFQNLGEQRWRKNQIFRVDTSDGRVLDSIFISLPDTFIGYQMAFTFDKFWLMAWNQIDDHMYVFKIDTLGSILGRFLAPIVPPASGNGLCAEGDKLWMSSNYDSLFVSGVFLTDTLGQTKKFVRIDYNTFGVPGYLAFWPKAPGTLFVANAEHQLFQITTDDTVARLVRSWPSPFPFIDLNIHGSAFDAQDYFWANCTHYPWIYKVDLGLTGVAEGPPLSPKKPDQVLLLPPAPAPSSSEVLIRFELPATSHVGLSLFDMSGRRVHGLIDGALPAGAHQITWNGCNDEGQKASAGVYFLRLEAGKTVLVRKVVVIR